MSWGVNIGESYMDWMLGCLLYTGKSYVLAIQVRGFFAVKVVDSQGNSSIKYTRCGTFKCTSDGYIVDADGNRLQGSGGDVQVPTDAREIAIKEDGTIMADGQPVNRITLTDFADYNYLELYGDNMYNAVKGATITDAEGTLAQGFTEQSNLNVVSAMASMMTITRAYQAGQKMIRTQDSLLDADVNQIGKV